MSAVVVDLTPRIYRRYMDSYLRWLLSLRPDRPSPPPPTPPPVLRLPY